MVLDGSAERGFVTLDPKSALRCRIYSYLGVKTSIGSKAERLVVRPRILLVLQGASWARDFFVLSKALVAAKKYEIEVAINFAGPVGEAFRKQCAEIGVHCFDHDQKAETKIPVLPPASRRRSDRMRNGLSVFVRRIPFLHSIFIVSYQILQFHKSRIAARRFIASRRPKVVVISGYSGFHSAFLIKEAARRGAGLLRLDTLGVHAPAWRANWRDTQLGDSVAVSTIGRKILAAIFPKWTFRFPDGRRIFYDTPISCVTAWLCGAMPKNPFAIGYGQFAVYTAIHEFSRRAIEAAGIEPHRIHLVGRLQDDLMFSAVANALNNRKACMEALELDPQKPLILCSSAPFVEHNIMTADEQTEYHDVMMSELATIENAQIVLSMHPAQKDTKAIYEIATRHGVRVLTSPGINEILPLATLYVDGESTVGIMAATCGVPMILTFFEKQIFPNGLVPEPLREPVYNDYVASLQPPSHLITKGQVIVRSWRHVASAARRCLNDSDYYAMLVEKQRQSARLWSGAFDGKAAERAARLVENLALGRPSS